MNHTMIIPHTYFNDLRNKKLDLLPLSDIETGLRTLLNTDKSPHEKVVLYIEILERFLRKIDFDKEQKNRDKSPPSPTADTSTATTSAFKPDSKFLTVKSEDKFDILTSLTNVLTKNLKSKGLGLYHHLKTRNDITWGSDLTVTLGGVKYKGSNIIDLIRSVVSPLDNVYRVGGAQFRKFLTDINTPAYFIAVKRYVPVKEAPIKRPYTLRSRTLKRILPRKHIDSHTRTKELKYSKAQKGKGLPGSGGGGGIYLVGPWLTISDLKN